MTVRHDMKQRAAPRKAPFTVRQTPIPVSSFYVVSLDAYDTVNMCGESLTPSRIMRDVERFHRWLIHDVLELPGDALRFHWSYGGSGGNKALYMRVKVASSSYYWYSATAWGLFLHHCINTLEPKDARVFPSLFYARSAHDDDDYACVLDFDAYADDAVIGLLFTRDAQHCHLLLPIDEDGHWLSEAELRVHDLQALMCQHLISLEKHETQQRRSYGFCIEAQATKLYAHLPGQLPAEGRRFLCNRRECNRLTSRESFAEDNRRPCVGQVVHEWVRID
jgi:hypothetical protein